MALATLRLNLGDTTGPGRVGEILIRPLSSSNDTSIWTSTKAARLPLKYSDPLHASSDPAYAPEYTLLDGTKYPKVTQGAYYEFTVVRVNSTKDGSIFTAQIPASTSVDFDDLVPIPAPLPSPVDLVDAAVAAVVNGALSGPAISARSLASAKPAMTVNPITGYYHADSFGADPTGVADSAAAINAALVAAPDHSVLYFAPGRYKVTAPVSIPSNRSIEMAPEATIVRAFNTTGNTGGTFINSDQTVGNVNINIRSGRFEAETSARLGKHLSFVKVNGLKIEGPGLYGVYGDWNSTFKNCSNLIIRGLRWDSGAALYTDGIHIYGGSGITISDCILSAGDDALSLTVEAADCDWIQDVTISNMVLTSNNASMIKLAVASTATTGIRRVTMNNIVGSHGPGVGIWSRDLSAAKDRIYDISISNALINSGSATNSSIYFENGAKRVSLTNVTAVDPNGLPFKMDGGSDLALVNFRTFGQRGSSQPGVRLDGVDGFEIRGGSIVGATGVGILLGSSAQVKNGRISGVSVRSATSAGIRFINTDGVTLTGSSISACSSAYIEDSPSTNNAILSNDLRANTSVPGSYSASNLVTANNRGVASSAAPSLIVPPVSIFLAPGFTAWSAANRAVYARFQVATETIVRYVNWGVGTASGNVQVGIVKLKGSGHASYDRIVATAIIACPTAGDVRTDLGATTLAPGDYAAFIWADNTTVTVRSGTSANLPTLRMSAIESSATTGVSTSGALSYSNQYVQVTLEADI